MTIDLAPWLVGGGFGALGVALLCYCLRGWRRGRITPMIRSYRDEPYGRRTEPKRFWASLIYNVAVGGMLLLGGTTALFAEARSVREQPFREACLGERQKGSLYETIGACERWVQRFRPDSFDLGRARHTQAAAHAQLGEQREATLMRRAAIGSYGRSLSGFPNDSGAYWNIAMLLIDERDYEQARQPLQAYVELEPDRGDGWLELGFVELARNDYPSAIVNLSRAIERLPGEARPLAARAIAFSLSGDRVRGGADLDAARRIEPENELVKEADRLFAADPLPVPTTSRRPQ